MPPEGIEDQLSMGFNVTLITTTPCSPTNRESLKVLYAHPQSLGITLETFHFPETVQVFSNPTTHHSEQHQPPIKQKTTTIHLIIYKHSTQHTLNYTISLMVGLSGGSQTLGVTKNFYSPPFLIPPGLYQKQNIKPQIHPAYLFHSATPGTKRRTLGEDLLGGKANTCN